MITKLTQHLLYGVYDFNSYEVAFQFIFQILRLRNGELTPQDLPGDASSNTEPFSVKNGDRTFQSLEASMSSPVLSSAPLTFYMFAVQLLICRAVLNFTVRQRPRNAQILSNSNSILVTTTNACNFLKKLISRVLCWETVLLAHFCLWHRKQQNLSRKTHS